MIVEKRYSIHPSGIQIEDMRKLGAKVIGDPNKFTVVVADAHNVGLTEYLEKNGNYILSRPIFEKEELANAGFSGFMSSWKFSYPYPDQDFSYRNEVYENSNYCEYCGIGLSDQISPFRVTSKKRWGSRGFGQLHWHNGEIFSQKSVADEIFPSASLGQVLDKTGAVIDDLVQIHTPIVDPKLDLSRLEFNSCDKCGRTKFVMPTEDFFPSLLDPIDITIFKISTWFGSGSEAWQPVLINNDAIARVLRKSARDVILHPTQFGVGNQ